MKLSTRRSIAVILAILMVVSTMLVGTVTASAADSYGPVILDASGVDTGYVEWYAWTWADGEDGRWVAGHGTSAADITYEEVEKNIIFVYFTAGIESPDWNDKIGQTSDLIVQGDKFTIISIESGTLYGDWSDIEQPTSEAAVSEAAVSEAATSEAAVSEAAVSEAATSEAAVQTQTILYSDTQNWNQVNIYYWGGTSSIDWPGMAMTYVGTNNYGQNQYTAEIPADATHVIFHDGSTQTEDVDLVAGVTGYYFDLTEGKVKTWTDGDTSEAAASEAATSEASEAAVSEAATSETGAYYLIGNFTDWSVDPAYELAFNDESYDGGNEYVIKNVAITTNDQFKVVYVPADPYAVREWYPDGFGNNYGENGEIKADGTYNIYFRPEYNGDENWFYGCIFVTLAADTSEAAASEAAASEASEAAASEAAASEAAASDVATSEASEAEGFYLIGSNTNWELSAANKFAFNENALGGGIEFYVENVAFAANDEFKVVYSPDGVTVDEADGAIWYPQGYDNNYVVESDGTYNIYFRPDYDGQGDGWYYSCIYVAPAAATSEAAASEAAASEASEAAASEAATSEASEAAASEAAVETQTILYSDTLNWNQVNIYYWGGTSTIDWPGMAMTYVGTNNYGQNQYTAEIPADATNVIFNDGSTQTEDVDLVAGVTGYYFDWDEEKVKTWTDPAPTSESAASEAAASEAAASEASEAAVSEAAESEAATSESSAAGYYLIGTITNWGVDDAYKLAFNDESYDGGNEYVIKNVELTTVDQIKVIYSPDGASIGEDQGAVWFPGGMGNNYGENGEITADGTYNIYFRPDYNGDGNWFYSCIYVAPVADTSEAAASEAATSEASEAAASEAAVETQTILYSDTLNWNQVNIYYWGGTSTIDWPGMAMTYVGTNNYGQNQYTAEIPADATNVIFNDGFTQTEDVDLVAGVTGYYYDLTEGKVMTWTDGDTSESAASEAASSEAASEAATSEASDAEGFYLIGSNSNWELSAANKFAFNENALGGGIEFYVEKVAFAANDEFKVVYSPDGITVDEADGAIWYPQGYDNNYVVETGGTYNIYFRPDYDGDGNWFYSCIYVAPAAATSEAAASEAATSEASEAGSSEASEAGSSETGVTKVFGDVNGDNTVNNSDLILLRRYCAGYSPANFDETVADINNDGTINNSDLILLRRHCAGYTVNYPVGQEIVVKIA